MPFLAYEIALDLIRCLPPIIAAIRRRDPKLAAQAETAASSIPLNLAEGRRRSGKDRPHLFRIAAGSAQELLACLDVAHAWGYVNQPDLLPARAHLDRILGMTWRLTH